MTTEVVYSKRFLEHDKPNHPENARRLRVIMDALSPIIDELKIVEPRPINERELLSVHSEEMIDYVRMLSEREGGGWADLDTYLCRGSYEIALLAAGGVVQLAREVSSGKVQNGFALIRPPGHHATRDRAMGFCLFNNVALAANAVAREGKKVLIFDHDVHHGNGTQDIFYRRKDVLYQSLHLSPHYPGTGAIEEVGEGEGKGYTVNAPLPRGLGDRALDVLLDEIFIPIAERFEPDIIIVSAGFDSHYLDLLGGLRLTKGGFAGIIKRLQSVQSRLLCSLEGGYNLDVLGELVLTELRCMLGEEISLEESLEERVEETDKIKDIISRIREELGRYWDI